jgi:hypothetical protein
VHVIGLCPDDLATKLLNAILDTDTLLLNGFTVEFFQAGDDFLDGLEISQLVLEGSGGNPVDVVEHGFLVLLFRVAL